MALGSYKGKRIRAVAVCKEKDFNEDFGVQLAKMKYKIKEREAKVRHYEKQISFYRHIIEWANRQIKTYDKYANYADCKLQEDIHNCEKFVENYFI